METPADNLSPDSRALLRGGVLASMAAGMSAVGFSSRAASFKTTDSLDKVKSSIK